MPRIRIVLLPATVADSFGTFDDVRVRILCVRIPENYLPFTLREKRIRHVIDCALPLTPVIRRKFRDNRAAIALGAFTVYAYYE